MCNRVCVHRCVEAPAAASPTAGILCLLDIVGAGAVCVVGAGVTWCVWWSVIAPAVGCFRCAGVLHVAGAGVGCVVWCGVCIQVCVLVPAAGSPSAGVGGPGCSRASPGRPASGTPRPGSVCRSQ